jgi:hypothetical protein
MKKKCVREKSYKCKYGVAKTYTTYTENLENRMVSGFRAM